MKQSVPISTAAIVGGLTAFGLMGLAAVLFIPHGDESTQRLGAFFALASVVVTALVALLKADQAATSSAKSAHALNGGLDDRIQQAVLAANYTRRTSDLPQSGATAATPAASPLIAAGEDPASMP